MASLLDLNLSYYTVPAAFMLVMVPHAYAIALAGKNYDLGNPRKTEDHCAKDTTLDKTILRRISRSKAAAANGFETLGLYAAAVVSANVARVDPATLNKLTLGYLATRVVYNYTYVILQDNARLAGLRSLAWMAGLGIIFGLFGLAGRATNLS